MRIPKALVKQSAETGLPDFAAARSDQNPPRVAEEDGVTNRCEKTKAREPETESIASMLEKLIEKNRAHGREIEALAHRIKAAEAAAHQREAELAARLDEALGELAEAVAAVEQEKEKRIEAEQEAVAALAAIDEARQILDLFSAPPAAHAPRVAGFRRAGGRRAGPVAPEPGERGGAEALRRGAERRAGRAI
jgi:hypothetical protein